MKVSRLRELLENFGGDAEVNINTSFELIERVRARATPGWDGCPLDIVGAMAGGDRPNEYPEGSHPGPLTLVAQPPK